MQLVCKIKSEIIIIIISTLCHNQPQKVKPMEIKKALLLYQMLLIRRFEEKGRAISKSRVLHLYIGEEAVAVALCRP
jgi:TPP-dependent pyruvate/acetoin dehydrogenase alpha subunit